MVGGRLEIEGHMCRLELKGQSRSHIPVSGFSIELPLDQVLRFLIRLAAILRLGMILRRYSIPLRQQVDSLSPHRLPGDTECNCPD